jgi:hypothetical protein
MADLSLDEMPNARYVQDRLTGVLHGTSPRGRMRSLAELSFCTARRATASLPEIILIGLAFWIAGKSHKQGIPPKEGRGVIR